MLLSWPRSPETTSYPVAFATAVQDRTTLLPAPLLTFTVSGAVGTGTPSSMVASQSSSTPLHVSGDAPRAPGFESRQSPAVVMYPGGGTPPAHTLISVAGSPCPSPSTSL